MVAKKLEYHPASNLFPLMEGPEFAELVASIKEHGQQVPILLYQGKVIDGRNRLRACYEAGVDPQCEHSDLNGISPTAFVLIHNLTRRHLTLEQKAFVAVEALPHFEREAAERQQAGKAADLSAPGRKPPGRAAEVAGESVGVSANTVDRAAKVQELGSVALIEAAKAGTVPIATAAKLAELPKLEQTAALKGGKSGIKAALASRTPKEKPAPKPKAGQQKNDPRALSQLEDQIAKCIRMTDDAHRKFANAKQRDAVLHGFNEALKALREWRKAAK